MKLFIFLLLSINCVYAANLSKIKGDVLLNGKSDIVEGLALNSGDLLEAKGKESYFVVSYDDGSKFMIKSGILKIEKLNPERKESVYELLKGLMYTFVKPKADHLFSVKSKGAIFGVRGTMFWLSAEQEEPYLCVCEGSVEVTRVGEKILVHKKQDITVGKKKSLHVYAASQDMWNMAKMGLSQLGLAIED